MTDRADPLDKLQALGDEATEGPWRWDQSTGRCLMGPGPTPELEARGVGTHVLAQVSSELLRSTDTDALFIAVSRNVWNELLAVAQASAITWEVHGPDYYQTQREVALDALGAALDALCARIDQEVPDE